MKNQTIQVLRAKKLNVQEQQELTEIIGKAFPKYVDFRKQGLSKDEAYQKLHGTIFSELTDSSITTGDFNKAFDKKRFDYDLMIDRLSRKK